MYLFLTWFVPMFQDAVALALTFDRSIASAVATRAEDDEALQRKLWLAVARHLIDVASENSSSDPVLLMCCTPEIFWFFCMDPSTLEHAR